jgi:hypothetical protein
MRKLLISAVVLIAASPWAAAQDYRRGDEVRVQTPDGQPAAPPVQKVVAVPGDQVTIDGKRIVVNSRTVTDVSTELLSVCGSWSKAVPEGHYFLVGEQINGASTTRSCSLLPVGRILGGVRR